MVPSLTPYLLMEEFDIAKTILHSESLRARAKTARGGHVAEVRPGLRVLKDDEQIEHAVLIHGVAEVRPGLRVLKDSHQKSG